MTTAPAQPEDAIWQYGFGLPAEMRHGVRGTASGPSVAMDLLGGPTDRRIVNFYEDAADDSPASHRALHSLVQSYSQAWENQQQNVNDTIYKEHADMLGALANSTMTMTMASPATPSKPFPGRFDLVISRNLQYDALRFVSWLDGWDGEDGERIHCDVAFRALEIVSRLKPEFDEPFLAPAPSGAILLQWKLPDGNVVDVFVESADSFPECAVLTRDESVHDIELSSLSDLRSLLRNLESASASH